MGCDELIESLRQRAEETMSAIWRDTEEEGSRISHEAAARAARACDAIRAEADAEAARVRARIMLDAGRQVRAARGAFESALIERLRLRAADMLSGLAAQERSSARKEVLDSLPEFRWERIRANPRDAELIRNRFPAVEVVEDPGISGGVAAEACGGRICVDSTYEKRLETGWPLIVPELLRHIDEALDAGKPGKSS